MSICLPFVSFSISFCLSAYMSISFSVYRQYVYPSIYISVCFLSFPPVRQSVCLFVFQLVTQSVCSACLPVGQSVSQSVCLAVYLSVCFLGYVGQVGFILVWMGLG
jgi:hypothetical protein